MGDRAQPEWCDLLPSFPGSAWECRSSRLRRADSSTLWRRDLMLGALLHGTWVTGLEPKTRGRAAKSSRSQAGTGNEPIHLSSVTVSPPSLVIKLRSLSSEILLGNNLVVPSAINTL